MDFKTALNEFVSKAQSIMDKHRNTYYPSVPNDTLSVDPRGKKYIRVVREDDSGTSRSVHCFIEASTGNVLKAAGWKAPAKGIRGNIYDEHNGCARMGPYGPEYNR